MKKDTGKKSKVTLKGSKEAGFIITVISPKDKFKADIFLNNEEIVLLASCLHKRKLCK